MAQTILTIVLAIPGAESCWHLWAHEEGDIDFRRGDTALAKRCTAAFAAEELTAFWCKSDPECRLVVSSRRPPHGPFLELETVEDTSGGGFSLIPKGDGLVLRGHGRNGLMNAVYELLRLRGWRWLEPGPYGESAPTDSNWHWPRKRIDVIPSFKFRMIDCYRDSDDSEQFLLWLARQRCNVTFRKPATAKLSDKLGMLSRKGGHLLQRLLAPDRIMPDGQTIWDAHQEWFGMPADGIRNRNQATKIQLCLSQDSLIDFIADEILKLMAGPLDGVDIIDLWGFDTWGNNCACPGCSGMGNGADQNLHLLSRLRKKLTGRLPWPVRFNTISYEGTVTMEPPTKPVPANLIAAGDFVIFYPIRRCYRHLLGDRCCEINKPYRDSLEGWQKVANGLGLWSGEYYNVSKYEDLPLVFKTLIPAEMRYYHASGCNGATYMHNLSVTWGTRAITQLQHTQYTWNVNTDDTAFFDEYLARKYGTHAPAMRQAYDDIEEGMADVSSWRNWSIGALTVLASWDGRKPLKEFAVPHLPNAAAAILALEHSVTHLKAALALIRRELDAERMVTSSNLAARLDGPPPQTPADLERLQYFDVVEHRLEEDIRMLIYGLDTMELMLAIVQYHDARFRDYDANTAWERIEEIAARMSDYYVPLSFDNHGPGIICKDALTRTQLRRQIARWRANRK